MCLVHAFEEKALDGIEHETARLRGSWHLKREQIFARDEYRCVYCGQVFLVEDLSVDHVQPRVRGGDRSGGNLVTACRPCNALKGHRHIAEFLLDVPTARANFFQHARHVWARHLRAVEDEIARLVRIRPDAH